MTEVFLSFYLIYCDPVGQKTTLRTIGSRIFEVFGTGCSHARVFLCCQDAGGGTNWATTRHQLPPVWVDKVDAVEEDVRLIQLKSKSI